jgi:hypothetical protein
MFSIFSIFDAGHRLREDKVTMENNRIGSIAKGLCRDTVTATMVLAMSFLFSACASEPVNESQAEPSNIEAASQDKGHAAVIERNSAGEANYAGFYNTFEYNATLLNYQVREALVTRETEYYQWDAAKTKLERDKARQEMASETAVFLSFFTPDRHNDNLADTKAIWRIFLDVGGSRYTGKAKKLRTLLAELQALYPYHTRWNTPYMVTFPVPVSAIESQPSKLTITGPLGTKSVEFKALK